MELSVLLDTWLWINSHINGHFSIQSYTHTHFTSKVLALSVTWFSMIMNRSIITADAYSYAFLKLTFHAFAYILNSIYCHHQHKYCHHQHNDQDVFYHADKPFVHIVTWHVKTSSVLNCTSHIQRCVIHKTMIRAERHTFLFVLLKHFSFCMFWWSEHNGYVHSLRLVYLFTHI